MFCSKCILKHTEMKHEVIQISPKIDEMKKMIEQIAFARWQQAFKLMKSYHDRQVKKANNQGVNIALEPHETLYDLDEAPEALANMDDMSVTLPSESIQGKARRDLRREHAKNRQLCHVARRPYAKRPSSLPNVYFPTVNLCSDGTPTYIGW